MIFRIQKQIARYNNILYLTVRIINAIGKMNAIITLNNTETYFTNNRKDEDVLNIFMM